MSNPLTIVVFGATGDLYQNKLSLALFNLFSLGFLPTKFRVVGFARRPLTNLEFRNFTENAIKKKNKKHSKEKLDKFLMHLKYVQGNLENVESFKSLKEELEKDDEVKGIHGNKLFYLAVPPSLYGVIFKNISKANLVTPYSKGSKSKLKIWTRILVEKPFGKDIKEAKHLDKMLGELFSESQIFRIDHYLAKETMQNLLTFRFSNGVFESIWNNKNIERVRIVFYEENVKEDTIVTRGAFYDGVGALRDVGQNHMLQMLALIAMENPKIMNAEKIQEARSELLEKVSLFDKHSDKNILLRGQYNGYLNESNIKTNSKTETFFRTILGIHNKKWKGVPFEMESGKALDKEEMSIEVYFKKLSSCLCKNTHIGGHQNMLKFTIQPNEGIKFRFWFKRPGFGFSLDAKDLSFAYSRDNELGRFHDAYERILRDCFLGDQTLFTSTREIMAEWRVVTDIIKKWQTIPLIIYEKGSKGEDIK